MNPGTLTARTRDLLDAIQWTDRKHFCPCCGLHVQHGHSATCELDLLRRQLHEVHPPVTDAELAEAGCRFVFPTMSMAADFVQQLIQDSSQRHGPAASAWSSYQQEGTQFVVSVIPADLSRVAIMAVKSGGRLAPETSLV